MTKSIIQNRTKSKKGFQIEDWPSTFLEKIACPLCSSSKEKKIYPDKYKRLTKCLGCGLIYTNPRLKKTHLKDLYSKDYFCNTESVHFGYENYIGDENKIVTTFKKRVIEIEKIQRRGSLLDIGCATGFFMKAAYDSGWKVAGNEISEFAAEYARRHYKFNIFTQDFISARIPKNSFNVITMWDVIEHFYNPIQAVRKAYSLLKDDGILVLSTPDVNSLPAQLTKDKWVGYKLSDEHLTYFSAITIKRLLEENGFSIIKQSHVGKHVSLSMLADRASIYNPLFGKVINMISPLFSKKYFLYINPFDIMCIYARKNPKK